MSHIHPSRLQYIQGNQPTALGAASTIPPTPAAPLPPSYNDSQSHTQPSAKRTYGDVATTSDNERYEKQRRYSRSISLVPSSSSLSTPTSTTSTSTLPTSSSHDIHRQAVSDQIKQIQQLTRISKETGVPFQQLMEQVKAQQQQQAQQAATTTATSTSQQNIQSQQQLNPTNATKKQRTLYVGNLPVTLGLTSELVNIFFTELLRLYGIHTPFPIVSTWIHPDKVYTFIEFRSSGDVSKLLEHCSKGLQLAGRVLKVGRPIGYNVENENPALKDYTVPLTPEQEEELKNKENQQVQANGTTADENEDAASNIIVIANLLTMDELNDMDTVDDIKSDIYYELMKYGNVIDIKIPTQSSANYNDLLGNVYVKFDIVASADNARNNLSKRLFDQRPLNVKYENSSDDRIIQLFNT